jgi:hypothetical protein
MNRTSRSIRLLTAGVALTITSVLFHGVASLARPIAIEQVAQAKKSTVTIASVREAAPRAR